MKTVAQVGGLFLPILYHFIHSNMQCPSTFSPLPLFISKIGQGTPVGWRIPKLILGQHQGEKNHCSTNQFCKVFALSWGPDIPFVPEAPTPSQLIPLQAAPSLPTHLGCRDCLSAALNNPERVTHPLHYLYWLLTS